MTTTQEYPDTHPDHQAEIENRFDILNFGLDLGLGDILSPNQAYQDGVYAVASLDSHDHACLMGIVDTIFYVVTGENPLGLDDEDE